LDISIWTTGYFALCTSSEDYVYKEGFLDFIEVGSDYGGETVAQYIFE
jgi:hypothetical protein